MRMFRFDELPKAIVLAFTIVVFAGLANAQPSARLDDDEDKKSPTPPGLYITPMALASAVRQPLNPGSRNVAFCPRLQPNKKVSRSNFNQFSRHKILRPAKGYEPCRLLALARIKFTTNLLRSFAADSTFPSAFSPSFLHHFRQPFSSFSC